MKNILDIKNEGIILERVEESSFEDRAVLNPTCMEIDGIVHMYYRAVRKDRVSSIGYCQLKNNKVIYRASKPVLFPEYSYEKMGEEDPRLVYLDGVYYLFYVAYDGENAQVAYATSNDLKEFKKQGIISSQMSYAESKEYFCEHSSAARRLDMFKQHYKFRLDSNDLLWEKDAFLFPKKFNGRFAMMWRILPGIQIMYFDDFTELTDEGFWKNYLRDLDDYLIMEPGYQFENKNIGGGGPPMLTDDGWLMIFHSVEKTKDRTIYRASAALLDRDDPTKVIGRLSEPLFEPEEPWELKGDINDVVFPTATVIEDDRLMIYYGAADTLIAAKSLNLNKLMQHLKE